MEHSNNMDATTPIWCHKCGCAMNYAAVGLRHKMAVCRCPVNTDNETPQPITTVTFPFNIARNWLKKNYPNHNIKQGYDCAEFDIPTHDMVKAFANYAQWYVENFVQTPPKASK